MKNSSQRNSRYLLLPLLAACGLIQAGEPTPIQPAEKLDAAVDALLEEGLQNTSAGSVIRTLERMQVGLRAMVNAPSPKLEDFGQNITKYDEARYGRDIARFRALMILSELRNPQDLPLFWRYLEMRTPLEPWLDFSGSRNHKVNEALYPPVAKALAKYGLIARHFIITQIAKGEANDWIRPKDEGKIRGIYHVFGETWATGMARGPEEDLGHAAEIAKPDEKENILKFIALLKSPQPKGKKEE